MALSCECKGMRATTRQTRTSLEISIPVDGHSRVAARRPNKHLTLLPDGHVPCLFVFNFVRNFQQIEMSCAARLFLKVSACVQIAFAIHWKRLSANTSSTARKCAMCADPTKKRAGGARARKAFRDRESGINFYYAPLV